MLFKNILRTISQKPLQFFALMILITMSSFTYVTLYTGISSVEYFLDGYTSQTNQEDFLVVLSAPNEQSIRAMIAKQGVGMGDLVGKSKTEMMKTYEYNLVDYYEDKIDALSKRFNATIEGRFYRDVIDESSEISNTFRFIKPTESVNSTYVLEGVLPKSDTDIAVFKQYGDANDLSVGDSLTINDQDYTISAFVAVPDYIYPIFSYDNPLFESNRETIAIVTEEAYDALSEKQWVLYSGYFNDEVDIEETVKQMSGISGVSYAISKNQNVRISTVDGDLASNELLSNTFSALLLVMCVIIIILILRKRINADRVQIGVLKAMGYNRLTITLHYLTYPLLAALCGTFIGSCLGIGMSSFVSNSYMKNYIVPNVQTYLTKEVLVGGTIIPLIVVSISSFIILMILLRQSPLELMKESSHLKVSKTSQFISNLLKPLKFESRFKYALAFRNIGKILSLFVIVLVASIFLVFASIMFKSVENIVEKAFGTVNYDYQIKYSKLIDDPYSITESPFLEYSINPLKKTRNNEEVEYESSTNFVIYGIDPYNIINPLYNAEGEDITIAARQGVLINEFIARAYDLQIGDWLTFEVKGKKLVYPVSGIVDHYNGPMIYTNMKKLAHDLNIEKGVYNGLWSNQRPATETNISYVFSISDLARNIEVGMEMIRVSLSIMLVIAIILGCIIMILITNFIIDDNQKQISILKVMGYSEKEISKMVLTVYFPFVVLAYLISVPITRAAIDFVMNQIAARLPMAIPTDFTFVQAIGGLSVILITYFIAMKCSRFQLDKISLHEVLKY